MDLRRTIEELTGRSVARLSPLGGGCIADVRRVDFADGLAPAVVKHDDGSAASTLECEAFMLRYLARRSRLPAPEVLAAGRGVLLLSFVETSGGITTDAQRHAAELLADLHAICPEPPNERRFGFERDTVIGPLPQPNGWMDRWTDFFRERRLLPMAETARRRGGISGATLERLERLAARLGELINEPAHPSLIHGDVWSGNVLCREGRVAAFIDPAIAYAHPEQELAFTTLFGTFGRAFFDRYRELRPIPPGFDDGPRPRRDVYNLYPLLVHAALFGPSYGADVDSIVRRMGF
jgi:fructosamine-3-kinase